MWPNPFHRIEFISNEVIKRINLRERENDMVLSSVKNKQK